MKSFLTKIAFTLLVLTSLFAHNPLSPIPEVHAAGEGIHGQVFEDLNHDGVLNGLETGMVGGIAVNLFDDENNPVSGVTTAADGTYSFGDNLISAGESYTIVVVPPAEWTNYDITAGQLTMEASAIGVSEDRNMLTVGLFHLVTIEGTVFYDIDGDGTRDGGIDHGIQGLSVSLYRDDDPDVLVAGAVKTNGSGEYTLTLAATSSANYYVRVHNMPSGYTFGPQNALNNTDIDDIGDSDFNSDGETDNISLNYGDELANADAAIILAPFTIGDFVFQDTDRDGIQDVGELGIEDVDVTLINRNNTGIAGTATTDTNGLYEISGNSVICAGGPLHVWTASAPETLNCNAPTSGGTYYVSFVTGNTCELSELNIEFLTADGITASNQSCGGSGPLHNNTPYLFAFNENSTGTAQLNFTRNGTLDPDGILTNVMIVYSNYRLDFDLPEEGNFSFISPQNTGGDETLDSDVTSSGSTFGSSSSMSQPYAGVENLDVDAGAAVSTANLTLTKSVSSPTGIPGDVFTYILRVTNTGPNPAQNVMVSDILPAGMGFNGASTFSGSYNSMTGEWNFSSLGSGQQAELQIFTTASGPGTIINTAEIMSADSIDPDSTFGDGVDQGDLKTASVTISSGGGGGGGGGSCENEDTCVGGRVFYDSNENGIQDGDETGGENGVSVGLIRVSDEEFVASTTTSGGGEYVFSSSSSDIQNGVEYRVKFLKPDNFNFTTQNQGADDDLDSDANVNNGTTDIFMLSAQEHKDNVDAGLVSGGGGGGGGGEGQGGLALHIFTDTNGNGIQDDGEPDGASDFTAMISIGEESMDITSEMNESGDIYIGVPATNELALEFILDEGTYITGQNNPRTQITINEDKLTDLFNFGIYTGVVGYLDVYAFKDTNQNGEFDSGEDNGINKIYLVVNGDESSPIEFPNNGFIHAAFAPDTYTFSIAFQPGSETILTSGVTPVEAMISSSQTTNIGYYGFFGESDGGGGGECEEDCGYILLHIFTDTNGNGVQSGDPEINGAAGTTILIAPEGCSDEECSLNPEPDSETGNIEGDLPVGTYTFTIIPPDGSVVTGGNASFEVVIANGGEIDLGSRGIYAGETGQFLFHIFTDDNGDGDQDSGEDDNADDTTLHILNTDDDSEQDVDFDSEGNIDSHLVPGNYTFTLIIPSGATVTGTTTPLNPITNVIITADETTDVGSRGIYIATSNGGGGGGGGGGSARDRASTRHVNWGDLGSNNDDGGSSWVSGSVLSSKNSNSTNDTPTNPLPPVVPTYVACMVSGGSSPKSFSDTTSTPDLDFLTSLTFISEPGRSLINGYSNGTFGPTRPLTRFELLKIALSSNCAGSGGTSSLTQQNTTFSDVPQDDSEQSRVIGEAYALGIIKGVDGKFYPDAPVSFAEMIKMLFNSSAYFKDGQPVAALEVEIPGLTDQSFAQAIAYAQRLEILPFTNDTPFPQNEDVERSTMITVLANFIRAMGGTVLVN